MEYVIETKNLTKNMAVLLLLIILIFMFPKVKFMDYLVEMVLEKQQQ